MEIKREERERERQNRRKRKKGTKPKEIIRIWGIEEEREGDREMGSIKEKNTDGAYTENS